LPRAPRALAAIIGTERHQTAHSGTESPEKVPNFVLQVFTDTATYIGRGADDRVRTKELYMGSIEG
jgi:hypothetical protein